MARVKKKAVSGQRPVALVAVFLIVSLVLCVVYGREGESGPLHSMQGAVSAITVPVQYAGSAVGQTTQVVQDSVGDLTADETTLSGLTEQNRELRELVAKTEEYRQAVSRLTALLNMKNTASVEGIGATVIGRSSEAWNQTVTLDAGSSSGVSAGNTVLGESGVIGQVVSCTPATCTVRLLTDPNSGVAVTIQSNRKSGVVRGSLDGMLYLESVDSDVTVQVGDVLVTSGLGGSYTKGLMVGTVVKVENASDAAARKIYVQANSSAKAFEEAFIVGAGTGDETWSDEDSQTYTELLESYAAASASASASPSAEATSSQTDPSAQATAQNDAAAEASSQATGQ